MIYWNVHVPHTVEHYKTCAIMSNIPFLFKYSFANDVKCECPQFAMFPW